MRADVVNGGYQVIMRVRRYYSLSIERHVTKCDEIYGSSCSRVNAELGVYIVTFPLFILETKD